MYNVYIPSMSRAGKATTHNFFKKYKFVVPESQVNEYMDVYGKNKVIGCPDDVKGITQTRNYILDEIAKNDKYHIQIDDDVKYFYKMERGEIVKITDVEHVNYIINMMFTLTDEWGLRCWGLSLAMDKKFYREYSPFSTLSVIGSNIIGIIKNPIRFYERLKVKEDYDYSLQHIREYRGVLRNNKYGVKVSHLTDRGGCSEYRTKNAEEDAFRILKERWGKIIKKQANKNFVVVKRALPGI